MISIDSKEITYVEF